MNLRRPAIVGTVMTAALIIGVILLRESGPPPGPLVVATSVPPVHGLVAAVMEGAGEPLLLFRAGSDPHHGVLKPSEVNRLQQARLVVWVGPGLEGFLARALPTLPAGVRVLQLDRVDGLMRHPLRVGGAWENGTAHDPGDGHAHADGAEHADIDPHLWLDPVNAERWVEAIALALADVDPLNSHRYGRNSLWLRSQLKELEDELATRMAPLAEKPFVVYHDAYRYFEERFGLRAVGAVATGDAVPGARRLQAIRALLAGGEVECLFVQPGFPREQLAVLREGNSVRVGELDALGQKLEPGVKFYPALLRNLATAYEFCLTPPARGGG